MSGTIRIYLKKRYNGEVCAGNPNKIYKVKKDDLNPALPRYFIEATEKEMQVLEKMGMLEVEIPVEPKVGKMEDDELPAPPVKKNSEDEYYCSKHNRTHRRGSASFIACYEHNFGKKEA